MRSSRHAEKGPTKEHFQPVEAAAGGSGWAELGAHVGITVDADAEEAYLELHTPHDFKTLDELRVVLIPIATLAPGTSMTMTVQVDHGKPNEPYNQHSKTLAKSFVAVANIVTEVDIRDLVDGTVKLEAEDYMGIKISRASGQNTNALMLGARIKYTAKKHIYE